MQVEYKKIPIKVYTRTESVSDGTAIRSIDTLAYYLEIEWLDVVTISATCQLIFELTDGTSATRDSSDGVVVAGNKVTYTLEPELYAATGLICYVQFITGSALYTALKITFGGIEVVTSGAETDALQTYPAWAAAMQVIGAYSALTAYAVGNRVTYSGSCYECIVATTAGTLPTDTDYWILVASKGDDNVLSVGTVTTLAAGAAATAQITGSSPTQVLNLGIPQGDAGTINTSTNTDITGVIAGSGAAIRAATAADGDALPVTGGTLGAQLSAIDTELAKKANKAQESWISAASLLNGWSGSVRYAKNSLGFVTIEFDVVVGTGTVNTNFASLPAGYRPLKFRSDNILNTSTFGLRSIVITDGGFIQLLTVTTTGQTLKGVVSYYVGV